MFCYCSIVFQINIIKQQIIMTFWFRLSQGGHPIGIIFNKNIYIKYFHKISAKEMQHNMFFLINDNH